MDFKKRFFRLFSQTIDNNKPYFASGRFVPKGRFIYEMGSSNPELDIDSLDEDETNGLIKDLYGIETDSYEVLSKARDFEYSNKDKITGYVALEVVADQNFASDTIFANVVYNDSLSELLGGLIEENDSVVIEFKDGDLTATTENENTEAHDLSMWIIRGIKEEFAPFVYSLKDDLELDKNGMPLGALRSYNNTLNEEKDNLLKNVDSISERIVLWDS